MNHSLYLKILTALFILQGIAAFAPPKHRFSPLLSLEASDAKPQYTVEKIVQIATTAAVAVAASPLVALAEEVDSYEYGAVNAPIGIAWAVGKKANPTIYVTSLSMNCPDAFMLRFSILSRFLFLGCLAILTALLPLALRGGEEAFEEIKERDAGKWGTGDSSSLNKKKRK